MTATARSGSYRSRLFGRGLYGSHHRARFDWLRRKLQSLGDQPRTFLELGCYDGQSIDYIPQPVQRYVGIDAGWESGINSGNPVGIDAAVARYARDGRFAFIRTADPLALDAVEGTFDVGICLETIEHLTPALVPTYIELLASKVHGTLLVSVPNEKGLPFLAKSVGAIVLGVKRGIHYRPIEFLHAALGNMSRVERNEHKGFDWGGVVRELRRRFINVSVEGIGAGLVMPSLYLTVGIVAQHSSRERAGRNADST